MIGKDTIVLIAVKQKIASGSAQDFKAPYHTCSNLHRKLVVEEDSEVAPCSETGAKLGDREADARELFHGGESGGREDCVKKLVRGGSGDGAASKQKATSGNIEVCVGDLQELIALHPRCSRSGAESDAYKNLAGGRESGVALHPTNREDDAELAVSHYICPGIVMKPMVHIPHLLRVLYIAPI